MKSAVWMLAACFSLTTAAPAPAADAAPATASAPPSMAREDLQEVSATVDDIDPATRLITLKTDGGAQAVFEAGPEVKNFAQIREGDKVVVTYYRGIAAELQAKGTPLSKKVDQLDVVTGAEPGNKPAGGVGTAVHATVVIEKADPLGYSVTFRRPDGTLRKLPVKSPEGQNFVAKLKKGDQVEVLYVEAMAVEVRPK